MKVLLLCDIPPCTNFTGGIMLAQQVGMLPRGSVACYAVVNRPAVNPLIPESLAWMNIAFEDKPREHGSARSGWRGAALSFAREMFVEAVRIPAIAKRAVSFGRDFGADVVWCVLQGQTMIRLARPVAKGLGVPLLTQVWDPPFWWMRAHRVDRRSAQTILGEFDETLRSSRCFAAASWAMAKTYHDAYGVEAIPVMPSLDPAAALPPAQAPHGDDLRIGMAGQTYATREWDALIAALDSVNWRIADRQVKIRLLGSYGQIRSSDKSFIEYLGWRSQPEAIRLLAETDVLYCPYWFDKEFEIEARLSFPAKLTTYFAAGRPVMVHGPEYASPARFVVERDAGVCCYSLEAHDILRVLTDLVLDQPRYARLTRNANQAFHEHLTTDVMRANFFRFLGLRGEKPATA